MRALAIVVALLTLAAEPATDQTLRGRIVSIPDAYHLTVRDERGSMRNVELRHGTIINPTGLTLAPGMAVKILGYPADHVFAANEIDTPYTYVPEPAPVYYGPGWWYPGFGYGYGPAFVLQVEGGHLHRHAFERHRMPGQAPRPR